MKYFYAVFAILFYGVSFSTLYSQTFSDPVAYNDAIISEQAIITAKNMDYIVNSVHSNDHSLIERKRQEVMKQIKESMARIKALPDYEGDTKIRDESVAVLEIYLHTFEIDFNEALLLKMDSEKSYEAMEKYFKAQESAEKKLEKANDRLEKAQNDFASKHNIVMVEDERASQKFETISDLNKYTRDIYLLYFKVSKTNAGFLDALNEQKAGPMEAKRSLLLTHCNEALVRLGTIGDFKGDRAYLQSCIDLVTFHRDLAKDDFVKLVEITNKKDALTQEDVASFNTIVQEFNSQSQVLINKFNEENSNILKKHIPQPGKRT